MSKKCSKCSKEKSYDCFHKNKKTPDDHQSRCKSCNKQSARQNAQLNRKRRNAYQKAYFAKRRKEDLVERIKHQLRSRLNDALNKGIGADSSCIALFGKTKEDLERYLHAHHEFGMDAARNYIQHALQPQFKPKPLTDDQRSHFCEQRNSILTYDHTVPIKAFDLLIPLDDDGKELFQQKFKRFKATPAPLPTPWQRVAFSYTNTKRMWTRVNISKGATTKNNSKELLLEKYLRNCPYI